MKRDTLAWIVIIGMLAAFAACDLSLLNEQEQGPTEPDAVEPTAEPTPNGTDFSLISFVELKKSEIGSCDTGETQISASCEDPALLTCRAKDVMGNDLTRGLTPSWFSQAPVTVAASNVNQWNARAVCGAPGETGSVICQVTPEGDTTRRVAAEAFFECVE